LGICKNYTLLWISKIFFSDIRNCFPDTPNNYVVYMEKSNKMLIPLAILFKHFSRVDRDIKPCSLSHSIIFQTCAVCGV